MYDSRPILLVVNKHETSLLPTLKGALMGAKHHITNAVFTTAANLNIALQRLDVRAVITTQPELICKLAEIKGDPDPKQSNYEGSIIHYAGVEVLCLPQLMIVHKKTYGSWLIKRFISKITAPQDWPKQTKFSFKTVHTAEDCDEMLHTLSAAEILVIDVENDYQTNVAALVPASLHPKLVNGTAQLITEIGFTGMFWDERAKEYITLTYTMEMWPEAFAAKYAACKALIENDTPKCLQNGKSDIVKLIRYGIVLNNYQYDTLNLMHCMYSELPKSLDFLMAFGVRDMTYWKWMGKSQDPKDREVYNALDTWATANALIALIAEGLRTATWYEHNYHMEFPVVFPSLYMELHGIPFNMERVRQAYDERIALAEELRLELEIMTGFEGFNPNSPKQVKNLIHSYGYKDVESTNEKDLDRLRNKDPILGRIIIAIIDVRGLVKEASTYLAEDKFWDGKYYACFNPHGTDTGRLASTEHHLNVGGNEQNIPRQKTHPKLKYSVKDCAELPEGWLFAECDYAQAESRDTAYITGDLNYLKAVDESEDFHKYNASKFFGVPYEEVTKELRQLGKPVNHGANYNMGAWMMLRQMGEKQVANAKKLLGLPPHWSLIDVCEHLLAQFDKAYPVIRGAYQDWVKAKVSANKLLVNPLGWTRYCFGNPSRDKLALNAYVAHTPQSLNGSTLNKAVVAVFENVVLRHGTYIKLFAQIHDSILMAYRILEKDITNEGITIPATTTEPAFLPNLVVQQMEFPVPVTDIFKAARTLRVPADCKYGSTTWGGIKE